MIPLAALGGSAFLFCGCSTYEARPLAPAATAAQLDARRLNDPGLAKFLATHGQPAGPVAGWDLGRLTLTAFYFSPDLAVARAQLAEAEAGVRAAAARPNPSFQFTPTKNLDPAAGISPWTLAYALNLPLELFGQREQRTTEAQQRAESSRLQLARAAWTARSGVRRALADWHGAEADAALWREQQPLLAETARLVEARVNAGDTAALTAMQVRADLGRAELAARESERAVVRSRSRLAETIGVPLAALEGVQFSTGELLGGAAAVPATDDARLWATQNHAELLAALADYAASDAALRGELARQYPDLSIGPGYQLDKGERKWTLGVGVKLPVFHQNQGPIAVAQAKRETAAAKFLAVQSRVLAAVDRAAADYGSTLGDLQSVAALQTNLEKQLAATRAQESAGDGSRLDVARARLAVADVARTALAVRVRAMLALGAFEDAVQRPLSWPEAAWRTDPKVTAK